MHATIVVPTRDHPELVAMAHATIERAGWADAEAVFVDNGTTDPAARNALRQSPHRVVRADIPFNFPRLVNRGASMATGEVVVLLNNDVEAKRTGWLRQLLVPFEDPDVGIAGAVLEYPSGCIQHCGIGIRDGAPVHLHVGERWDDLDVAERNSLRKPLAVTAACMAVRTDLWRALGGMSTPLASNYNDVDLCLRARWCGARVMCVRVPGLIHHESESRGPESGPEIAADWLLFRSRWADPLRASRAAGAEEEASP